MLDIHIEQLLRDMGSVRLELLDAGDIAGAAKVLMSIDTIYDAWLAETI